jgi:hypothetical protein
VLWHLGIVVTFRYSLRQITSSVTQKCCHTSGNKHVVTLSHTRSVSLRLKNLLCDELTGGGKRIMATKNTACYYGLHFGCINTFNDPNCRQCAERLTNAVNHVLCPAATSKSKNIFNIARSQSENIAIMVSERSFKSPL